MRKWGYNTSSPSQRPVVGGKQKHRCGMEVALKRSSVFVLLSMSQLEPPGDRCSCEDALIQNEKTEEEKEGGGG